ncbi:MAG: hypothetical protein JEZ14_01400 [Marinilabiliaceae bacterium]|nr:hypothetical protein [Marinilabiliaceae bacterium]
MRKYLFLLIVFSLIVSCEEDEITESSNNDRFLEIAYNKRYQYPDGFYYEKNLIGYVYYENSVSIKPITERARTWIELNTDDKKQAKTWSNLSNEYSSVNREIVEERETDKYFEIVRVNIQNENDTLLSRVHRTEYFVSKYDKFTDVNLVGIYNGELSITNVKQLIEYLWSCGTLGIYDKVVESSTINKGDKFEHYIQSLKITQGDFGIHDMIRIYDNKFHLDKINKILTIQRELVKEIQGNFNEGW